MRDDHEQRFRRRLLERFLEALHAGSHEALLSLFADDATWTSDGGGKVKAARKVVRGADHLSRFTRAIWERYLKHLPYRVVTVNGEAGLVAFHDGAPVWCMTIDTDGRRIRAAYVVINPDKLTGIARLDEVDRT